MRDGQALNNIEIYICTDIEIWMSRHGRKEMQIHRHKRTDVQTLQERDKDAQAQRDS